MQARIEAVNIVERTAQFENQLTAEIKTNKLQLYYLGSSSLVNLTLSLKISNLQRQMLTNTQLFYMNPTTRVCQYLGVYPFQEDIFVEIDLKSKEKIHFKFRKMGAPTVPNDQATNNKNSRKCRERTIGEVRNHLENRNKLYRNASGFTLQQAADMVGLPKKTLDDYDRHIRIAEAYGFDFERYKHCGMGVLRSFVKEQSTKQKPDCPVKEEFIEPGYFLSMGPNGQP